MAKTRLCNKDEWELQEVLEEFRNKLQEIGISGDSSIMVRPSGDIYATFNIDVTASLSMEITCDGDRMSKEYCYGNVTR